MAHATIDAMTDSFYFASLLMTGFLPQAWTVVVFLGVVLGLFVRFIRSL